jgi:hypothetical protein
VHPVHLGAAALAQHPVVAIASNVRGRGCPDRRDRAARRFRRRLFGHVRDYGMTFLAHAAQAPATSLTENAALSDQLGII